ncbi:MAG: hypothetical protein WDM89_01515 [Rhizomicrobium sp.]
MTPDDLLDTPIRTALMTRQAHLAEINGPARRYPADIAPFASVEAQTSGKLGSVARPDARG